MPDSGVKEGGCRRYDCEVPQLNWSGASAYAQTLRRYHISSVPYSAKACPAHQSLPRNLHGNEFPIHAEPSNNTKQAAQGQVFLSKFPAQVAGCPMFDA